MFARPRKQQKSPPPPSGALQQRISPPRIANVVSGPTLKTPFNNNNDGSRQDVTLHSPSRYHNLLKRFKDMYAQNRHGDGHSSDREQAPRRVSRSPVEAPLIQAEQRQASLRRLKKKIFDESAKGKLYSDDKRTMPLQDLRLRNMLRKGVVRKLDFDGARGGAANETSMDAQSYDLSQNLCDAFGVNRDTTPSNQTQQQQHQHQQKHDKRGNGHSGDAYQHSGNTILDEINATGGAHDQQHAESTHYGRHVRKIMQRIQARRVSHEPPRIEISKQEKLHRRNSLKKLYSPKAICDRVSTQSAGNDSPTKNIARAGITFSALAGGGIVIAPTAVLPPASPPPPLLQPAGVQQSEADQQALMRRNLHYASVKTATIQLTPHASRAVTDAHSPQGNALSPQSLRAGTPTSPQRSTFQYVPAFFTVLQAEQIQKQLRENRKQRKRSAVQQNRKNAHGDRRLQ